MRVFNRDTVGLGVAGLDEQLCGVEQRFTRNTPFIQANTAEIAFFN